LRTAALWAPLALRTERGPHWAPQRPSSGPLPWCRPKAPNADGSRPHHFPLADRGHPGSDGSCELQLDELEQKSGVRLSVEARWRTQNGFFLTTATARMHESGRMK